MAKAVGEPQLFRYEQPEIASGKAMVSLFQTDIAWGYVQVLREGGETNLHSHTHMDGFWMVLSGRAKFYTEGDRLIADLGKYEGVLIPRGYPYWFESASEEPLELLQVESFDRSLKTEAEVLSDRNDFVPRPPRRGGNLHVKAGQPKRTPIPG
jgi:quercetin dioxygenase-like cupin family protein